MKINTLAGIVLSARRKGFFRQNPIFKLHRKTSSIELFALEKKIGMQIHGDLRDWLLAVGYGDIDEEISFREEWFSSIETGQLKGSTRFAQDILGNFYSFDSSGRLLLIQI
ncbi:hypothetical protein [Ralstonia pseudosolanacearum]